MKYKSEIYEVVHQDATAMHEIGAISEAEMQEFNKMCLVKENEAGKVNQETLEPVHIP